MIKETVYGFVLDSASRLKAKLDTPTSADQGVGVLVGESANYLVKKTRLIDNRSTRAVSSDNKYIDGRLEIAYDASRVTSTSVANLTSDQQSAVFSILECIYTQDTQTHDQIETILSSDSLYTGYVENSYFTSTEYTTAKLIQSDSSVKSYKFANWIEFEFLTDEVDLVFHLWISNQALVHSILTLL